MKNSLILFILFVSTSFFAQVKNVDAAEFKKRIEENKYTLIDLRTPDEIKSKGKIKNAVEIDFLAKDSETQLLKLDKSKNYLVYCAGGGRSLDCAEFMQKNGFNEVINLEKGFSDWKNKGYEIQTK